MKAIVFRELGKLEKVTTVEEVSVPKIQHGEVLIRVRASSIHPADAMFVAGRYRLTPQLPQIAGIEGVGEIVQVDENAGSSDRLKVGDRVGFLHPGTWCEFVCVPTENVYRLSSTLTWSESALCLLNPLSALGLIESSGLKSGDFGIVTAAGSNVGRWMATLARSKSINLLGIVRSSNARLDLEALGFHKIFEESSVDSITLRTISGGGTAAAIDCVGGAQAQTAFDSLSNGGKMILYGDLTNIPISVPNSSIIYRNLTISGFGIRAYIKQFDLGEIEKKLDSIVEIAISSKYLIEPDEHVVGEFPGVFQTVLRNLVLVF